MARGKVVYADFVTGMMSFFLLMWLIHTTGAICGGGIPPRLTPSSCGSRTVAAAGIGA
jgi:flagellar motor protein MotB